MQDIDDSQIWNKINNEDLWIFDKLIVSRKFGHICGPSGIDVPSPNYYVVRPCVNILGMGKGACIVWLDDNTDYLPPGSFWQQVFNGRHLSIDYVDGIQVRCTEGIPVEGDLSRFSRWIVVSDKPIISSVLQIILRKHPIVNVEMIGGNVIEIHLRGNPDFCDGALELLPIWKDNIFECPEGFKFVDDPAANGNRIGFYKRYC